MGGPRITQEQISKASRLRLNGLSYEQIGNIIGTSGPAIRGYIKDVVPDIRFGENEELADIEGYEGRYKITSYGRVFTLANGEHNLKELHVIESKKGLRKVALNHAGEKSGKVFFIDMLVANAFVERYSDNAVNVWHIDGDLSNDCASNLRWSVEKQTNRSKKRTTPNKKAHSLTDEEKLSVREEWLAGIDLVDIAAKYDVSVSTARKALEGAQRDFVLPECEPGEEWKEIAGYGGRYYISSHGRLFSTGQGRRRTKAKLSHPTTDFNGYLKVALVDNEGNSRNYYVHRLVAEAFCEGHSETCNFVNHKDGDILNNDKSNLEWCTAAYNTAHASRVLGRKFGGNDQTLVKTKRNIPVDPTSRTSPFRKFTDDEVRSIRADNRSAGKIAEEYGVTKSTILRMKHGETYKNI